MHTSWRIVRNILNKRIWAIIAGDEVIVAECTEDDNIARLIASAPDLLETL